MLTTFSADPKFMCDELYTKYILWKTEMGKAGLLYVLTFTARTLQFQAALYAQGRQPLDEVNKLRACLGLTPISDKENVKVTWTMLSFHVVDLLDGRTDNDKCRAFDFALERDVKHIHYDTKLSINNNAIPDYREAGLLGEKVGLVAGMRFKNLDWGHLQIKA